MHTFALLLLLLLIASAIVAANSTSLKGASTQLVQDKQLNHRRRLQESTCTLYTKCVTYLPTEEHPYGYHKDSWVCELSGEDSRNMHVKFVDIVESPAVAASLSNATSGKSTLTMSEAIVDTNSPRMFIPKHAKLKVGSVPIEPRMEKHRYLSSKMPATTGTLSTLVIRVTDGNNKSPGASLDQMKNAVFDDELSLSRNTEECSYGQLKIEPFNGNTPSNKNINDGIVDVKIDFVMGSEDDGSTNLADVVLEAANDQLGSLDDSMFDLVMFCFPPGGDFMAFAFPGQKFSFYNDRFCGHVGVQMHEVGHNLNLAHSGQLEDGIIKEYGDATGLMGGPQDGRVCYNPQKNYALGWYKDKVETFNPFDGFGKREFLLNGVSDYKRNKDALVVLRLRQIQLQTSNQVQQDYYIGFNRATGINEDTGEDRDRVTIVRKESGAPEEYGRSTKVAALDPGYSKVLKNFNGEGDVQITFLGMKDGEAKIVITDNDKPLLQHIGNCKEFTIELNTDNYPEDNSWSITSTEGWISGVAFSPTYTQVLKKYVQNVCLPMSGEKSLTYKFTIKDTYKDGMCCAQGKGSYKAYNDKGKLIFSGGQSFDTMEHLIQVPKDQNPPPPTLSPTQAPTVKPTELPTKFPTPNPTQEPPTPNPTQAPTQKPTNTQCKDKKKGRWKIKANKGRKKNCRQHAKRKCNSKTSTGQFVWQLCPKSCKRCGDS